MSLREAIRTKRENDSLTLRELAAQLRMDYGFLCAIENGEKFPNPFFSDPLAHYLGIDLEELVHIIRDDKASIQISKIKIEALAKQNRETFLAAVGRSSIDFPKDRDRIPKKLCGLKVFEEETVFRAHASHPGDELIYAGLFPEPYTYRSTSNIIVVATKNVRNRRREEVSSQTKTFHVLHELGHYQLHWSKQRERNSITVMPERPLYCSSGDISPLEEQANLYASSFLMPRDEIRQLIGDRRSFDLHKEGARLCEHFFVERYMLRYRLKTIGIRII